MNINYTIINEIFSFIVFFIFSVKNVFPILIQKINNLIIEDYKKSIFIKNFKLIKKIFFNEINELEKNINNKFIILYDEIKNFIFNEKKLINNFINSEKDIFLLNIINLINNKNFTFFKKLFSKIKFSFLSSFKKIYNNIINYNNEFSVNNE